MIVPLGWGDQVILDPNVFITLFITVKFFLWELLQLRIIRVVFTIVMRERNTTNTNHMTDKIYTDKNGTEIAKGRIVKFNDQDVSLVSGLTLLPYGEASVLIR